MRKGFFLNIGGALESCGSACQVAKVALCITASRSILQIGSQNTDFNDVVCVYSFTAAVLLSPSSVDIVLAYVLRTFLSILVCLSHLPSLAVVLWGFCHAVVSPCGLRALLAQLCSWCCKGGESSWLRTTARGMFVMAPSEPYHIESLSQPQFPALMPRTDLLVPVLKVHRSVPGLLPKQQLPCSTTVSSPCGVVASVVSLEDTAQCHRALQRLSRSNGWGHLCNQMCWALRQAGACCEDGRVYHVI